MRILAVSLPLLVLAAAAQGSEVSENGDDPALAARAVVESLHEVLISCMMEADELGFRGRYDRIASNLAETFDLPLMARLSVGAAWKELSEEQRADFIDLSRRLSAASYADNFDGYGGERFDTLADEPAAHSTIVVKTELVLPKEKNVRFDYRLRESRIGWRIIDVQLDGKVSEITLRRADYRAVIERKGFPQLVTDLEKKVTRLSKE